MILKKDIIEIGKFQRTHALKGEINVLLEIEPEYFEDGNPMIVEMDGIFVPFYISGIRPKGKCSFLVTIEGMDTEEKAKQLVNKPIFANKNLVAGFFELDVDDLLEEDSLSGFLVVESGENTDIGVIERIDTSTPNPLFIVKTSDEDSVFIPAVEDFIDKLDYEGRRIFMTIPDGLLNLNKKTK